jgi:hypothetical protein
MRFLTQEIIDAMPIPGKPKAAPERTVADVRQLMSAMGITVDSNGLPKKSTKRTRRSTTSPLTEQPKE